VCPEAGRRPSTVGWGFGQFIDGRPSDDAERVIQTCFPCHQANVKGHDFVLRAMRLEGRTCFRGSKLLFR
jgi:hypothetical protein